MGWRHRAHGRSRVPAAVHLGQGLVSLGEFATQGAEADKRERSMPGEKRGGLSVFLRCVGVGFPWFLRQRPQSNAVEFVISWEIALQEPVVRTRGSRRRNPHGGAGSVRRMDLLIDYI